MEIKTGELTEPTKNQIQKPNFKNQQLEARKLHYNSCDKIIYLKRSTNYDQRLRFSRFVFEKGLFQNDLT